MTKIVCHLCLGGMLAASWVHAAEALRVSVSIPPLLGVARRVGGDAVEATTFMTEDDDPHTFSPTPRAVAMLRDCDLFVTVGVAFEGAVADKVRRMFPNTTVIDVSTGIDTAVGEDRAHEHGNDDHEHAHGHRHGHHGHGHDHALHDPHIWLSIPNLIRVAANIRDAYSTLQPGKRERFAANFEDLERDFRRRHAETAERLAPARGSTFYVYHPAFGYFARDYGLRQQAVEMDGRSPTPRQLMDLIRRAREENVRVVFVQEQFNQRPARILADRIGGQVIPLDPLAPDPLETIRRAADAIAQTH